jgi:hypothetical protein
MNLPARQPGQPLPGVGDVGQAGIGVFPEVEEFAVIRAFAKQKTGFDKE